MASQEPVLPYRIGALSLILCPILGYCAEPLINIDFGDGNPRNKVDWVSFTPGGHHIVVRARGESDEDLICIWSAEGKHLWDWKLDKRQFHVGIEPKGVFAPEGDRIVFTSAGMLWSGDLKKGSITDLKAVYTAGGVLGQSCSQIDKEGRVVVLNVPRDGELRVQKSAKPREAGGRELLKLSRRQFDFATLIAESNLLVASSRDGQDNPLLEVFELENKAAVLKIEKLPAPLSAAALSPDGELLAVGRADGIIDVYSLKGATLLTSLRVASLTVTSVAFHPFQKRVVVFASNDNEGENNVGLFDIGVRRVIAKLCADPNGIVRLAVSDTGKHVVTCGVRHLKLWKYDDLRGK